MILRKAEVIGHFDTAGTRHAIYSMDFQPNGSRVATCGGDSCVKLWAMNSLMGSAEEAQEALLATLTNHSKPVNVVRWSPDGRLLASGSDDNYILIHRYAPGGYSNQSFGSAQVATKNKENWIRCCTLQGHSMDVLDLDWSPDNILVSGSVDNHIMLWDVAGCLAQGRAIMSPTRILSGHRSFVKGVAFDPLGRYILSCGSDNIIIVWDSKSRDSSSSSSLGHHHSHQQGPWHVVRELTGPMRGTSDKSMFRRLSWAPDGLTVCFSGCLKSGKPVGTVLRRDTWDSAGGSACDLVGHEAPTVCSRFCPYVLDSRREAARPVTPTSVEDPALIEADEAAALMTQESTVDDASVVDSAAEAHHSPVSPSILASSTATLASPTRTSSRSRRLEAKSAPVAVTTAVKDSPALSSASSPGEEASGPVQTEGPFCLVALGDQQGVLSLWTPGRSDRPLVVLRHVFARNQPITDVSWVRTGRADQQQLYLACCSIDGCVLLVDLSVLGDALFRPLTPIELLSHSASSSSADLPGGGQSAHFDFSSRSHTVAQSTVRLTSATPSIAPPLQAHTLGPAKNGKKRIQPVLLQLLNGLPPSSAVTSSSSASVDSLVTHFSEGQEGDPVGRKDVEASEPATNSTQTAVNATNIVVDIATNSDTASAAPSSALVGRKRLRFADDDEHQSNSAHSLGPSSTTDSAFGGPSTARPVDGGMVIHDLNAMVRRKGGSGAAYYSPTRLAHMHQMQRHQTHNNQAPSGYQGQRTMQMVGGGVASRNNSDNFSQSNGYVASGAHIRHQISAAAPSPVARPLVQNRYLSVRLEDDAQVCSLPLLPVDGPLSSLSCAVRSCRAGEEGVEIQSLSACGVSVSLRTGDSMDAAWKVSLAVTDSSVVTSMSAVRSSTVDGLVVVGCSNGSLHLLSLSSGVRVISGPLVLGSAVAFCDVSSDATDGALRVLTATLSGDVQLWNVTRGEGTTTSVRVVCRTSLRPLLLSLRSVHRVSLDQEAFRKSAGQGSNHVSSGAVLSGSDKAVERHKLQSSEKLPPQQLQVRSCALSVDGGVSTTIAATCSSRGEDSVYKYTFCVQAEAWMADGI